MPNLAPNPTATSTKPSSRAVTALLRRAARGLLTHDRDTGQFRNDGQPLHAAEQHAATAAHADGFLTVTGENSPSGVAGRVELTVAGFAHLRGLPR